MKIRIGPRSLYNDAYKSFVILSSCRPGSDRYRKAPHLYKSLVSNVDDIIRHHIRMGTSEQDYSLMNCAPLRATYYKMLLFRMNLLMYRGTFGMRFAPSFTIATSSTGWSSQIYSAGCQTLKSRFLLF